MGIRFLGILAALAWQCCAIEIKVDTVFTKGYPLSGADTGARFTIRNTSTIDTVSIDTVYLRKLSPLLGCDEIGFVDSASHGINAIRSGYKRIIDNDTFFVSRPDNPILIVPRNSRVLTNVMVGNCMWCTSVQAGNFSTDQCVFKVMFVPNKGARDSVVLIGPKITMGTIYKSRSNPSVLGKRNSAMKLYDLSGRNIDIKSSRKPGVYIATYGRQADFSKKVLVNE